MKYSEKSKQVFHTEAAPADEPHHTGIYEKG